MSTELTQVGNGPALYRASTDAAGLCKEIVLASAKNIQGRKYVQVEGWQAIAIAHGCVASAGQVERVETGYRAIGRVIKMDNGQEIATAEGFVGDDEKMWAQRPEYARRAMAQTRAISRACRSAFAHVVVMMNAGLSTTPAEEVPAEGFEYVQEPKRVQPKPDAAGAESMLNEVHNCATLDELKNWFKAAKAYAGHDAALLARVTEYKDARKAELSKPAAAGELI